MPGILHPGTYSLTAKQVVKLLDGMKTLAVAAPAPNGDPLVGPMDGWFLHGKFFFSSGGDAVRIKGLRKRPRASIVYFEGERFAVTAHGHAALMYQGHPEVREIDAIFRVSTMGRAPSSGASTACTSGSTPIASSPTRERRRRFPTSSRARSGRRASTPCARPP
jgi:hypothetical protein